ncbi:MAG: hypothetical protein EPO24_16590 [Bacteroidetes bacterium]|nr:MAG: hypothetical protein EPO24_16590 [Bacteroidota bacterium]
MVVSEKTRKALFLSLAAIALVIGLLNSTSHAFVNDDCFVSFRCAKNFVNGHGLVYNSGEHVEAFTNFLWTLLIAVGIHWGYDPIPLTINHGILFYTLNLILFTFLSWKYRDSGKGTLLVLPLTSLALSLHRDFNVYATSGLETSMYTFLVSAGFALLLLNTGGKSLLAPGFVFVLAMMTRPDGFIFLVAAFVFLLLTRKDVIKTCLYFAAPSLIIFLPYWLWRYKYYGLFFPNSFYAKSADLAYYSQGLEYTWIYFKTYYGFFLIPALGGIYLWQRRATLITSSFFQKFWTALHTEDHPVQRILLALLFIGAYSFFIIRVGGDFMFARFFIPITPLLLFLIEIILNQTLRTISNISLAVLLLLATLFRFDQFKEQVSIGHVVDESRYYPKESVEIAKEYGRSLKKYFDGLPIRVAFWAGQLKPMYYAEPFYALEASAGLTDTGVARQHLTERGRPGHEKKPSNEYMIQKKIHFFIGPMETPPQGNVINAIFLGNIVARIVTYNNAIMSALEKYPDVHFVNLPRYLDEYLVNADKYPLDRVMYDYQFFVQFYFNNNQDTARQQKFQEYIRSKLGG